MSGVDTATRTAEAAIVERVVFLSALGGRIRELRRGRGMSQAALAKALSVVPAAVTLYEAGSRAIPCERLVQLAELFGVTTDFLLGSGAEAPEPPEYLKAYDEFWKGIVENPDGTLNKDQVARELFDYRHLMDSAGEVYCELSGFSKPNTAPGYVIEEARRRFAADAAADLLDDALGEIEDDGPARQVIIDAANRLSPGAYDEHVRGLELRRPAVAS